MTCPPPPHRQRRQIAAAWRRLSDGRRPLGLPWHTDLLWRRMADTEVDACRSGTAPLLYTCEDDPTTCNATETALWSCPDTCRVVSRWDWCRRAA